MIQVKNLLKTYGDLRAVDGMSFEVAAGESFGLLGPNGAGKTSAISMLVGALKIDGGEIVIGGRTDLQSATTKAMIGVVPQELAIYPELTAVENLEFFGALYGLETALLKERVAWCLEFSGLSDRAKDRADTFSGGMKRRLNLVCALVHKPRLLVCDEPTVGVDPQSRNHIFEGIRQLRDEGLTLIYTTHYMEEAEKLCDRVGIMDSGKILALDSVPNLIAAHGGRAKVEVTIDGELKPEWKLPASLEDGRLRFESDAPLEAIADLGEQGIPVRDLRIMRPDLEGVFLSLTGRSLRDS